MRRILTAAVAALTIGGTLAASVPASAQDRDGRRHHHDGSGAAVAAGVAGLAIGAALAGDHPAYYAPRPYYYDGPPPAYYTGPAYYSYYGDCHTSWRWNHRWHRYVRVRACY